jgi:hypothetical protein
MLNTEIILDKEGRKNVDEFLGYRLKLPPSPQPFPLQSFSTKVLFFSEKMKRK